MKLVEKEYDVGVIIGRFQLDELHEAHLDLVNGVRSRHQKTIVFLGMSPLKCTYNNPLDYEMREQMMREIFPKDVIVSYIKDQYINTKWSGILDEKVQDLIGENQSVVLYGGRDSFKASYTGRYDVLEMEQTIYVSASMKRKEIANNVKSSVDFRRGVIWATNNQRINPIPTVDIAIFDKKKEKILLGRKETMTKYVFPGGHVDLNESLEDTAIRETREETSVELENIKYVTSGVINDWRHRSEKTNIISTLFESTRSSGRPEPCSDLDELRWFDFNKHILVDVAINHQEFMIALLNKYNKLT